MRQYKMTHTTHSVRDTLVLARHLGQLLRGGEVLCLEGGLGTGKTCLVQGIASALKIESTDVSSPTFTIHHQYSGSLLLHHLDFYRIEQPEELEKLGLLELLDDPQAVVVIEWADTAKNLLPEEQLRIRIHWEAEHGRRFEMHAAGDRYCDLLKALEQHLLNPK